MSRRAFKTVLHLARCEDKLITPCFWVNIARLESTMCVVAIDQFGGCDVLQNKITEMPVPTTDEVLIKVKAASVNPIDIITRQGLFQRKPQLPLILGKEASGIVVRKGSQVEGFKEGDRVVCCLPYNGGYAEFVTCPQCHVFHLPDQLSFAQGATLYVSYFTAFRGLVTKANVKKGEAILIHGASGGVGLAALQISKALGLHVTGTAGSEKGIEVVKNNGADLVLNHRSNKYGITSFHCVHCFDIIFENCAHMNLNLDFQLIKKAGRIVVIGSKGSINVNPRHLIFTEAAVYGVNLINLTNVEFTETVSKVLDGIRDGWLRPVIWKKYPFRDVKKAHRDVENSLGSQGKLVIVPDNELPDDE